MAIFLNSFSSKDFLLLLWIRWSEVIKLTLSHESILLAFFSDEKFGNTLVFHFSLKISSRFVNLLCKSWITHWGVWISNLLLLLLLFINF